MCVCACMQCDTCKTLWKYMRTLAANEWIHLYLKHRRKGRKFAILWLYHRKELSMHSKVHEQRLLSSIRTKIATSAKENVWKSYMQQHHSHTHSIHVVAKKSEIRKIIQRCVVTGHAPKDISKTTNNLHVISKHRMCVMYLRLSDDIKWFICAICRVIFVIAFHTTCWNI